MKHVKFPSISQYRDIIKNVKMAISFQGKDENGNAIMDRNAILPTLKLIGTTKIHGTNAAIGINKNGEIWFQSRERIITPESDNAGFACFATLNLEVFKNIFKEIENWYNDNPLYEKLFDNWDYVLIYGEWAGGNIQSGIAINGLEKFFSIFDIVLYSEEDGKYRLRKENFDEILNLEYLNSHRIFTVYQFGTWEIEIDFNNPQNSQNQLVEWTLQVENECNVGKKFAKRNTGYLNKATIIDSKNIKFDLPIPEMKSKEIEQYFLENFNIGDEIEFVVELE